MNLKSQRIPLRGTLMKNMLFLVSSLHIGGSERKTVNIVNALTQRGIQCHLIYINEPDTLKTLVDEHVSVHCLDRRSKYDLRCIKKYVRCVLKIVETYYNIFEMY